MPPVTVPQAFALALQHHQAGRLAEAEAHYRQILAVQPNHAAALANLGAALLTQGRLDEAVITNRRMIQLKPDSPEAHYNLGIALHQQGQFDEAIVAFHRVIQFQPGSPEAHYNLGIALAGKDQFPEAAAAFERAVALKPDYADAQINLGSALVNLGRLDEAAAAFLRVIALQPNYPDGHYNLGNVLKGQGQWDEAVAAYRHALAVRPDWPEALLNLGLVLQDQGQLDEALAAYRRLIQLEPDCAAAHWNTSLALLIQGDFEHGWPLFESRWKVDDLQLPWRNFPQPMWQGEALHGQRILLHAEQGLGDTLQFVRYAPLVAARGGQVIVECQPELKTLLTSVGGMAQIIGLGEPLPAFDLHCPMLSLPLAFGTRWETIPAPIPYLEANPSATSRWRQRIAEATDLADERDAAQRRPLKIGLVWAGGERHYKSKLRPVDQRRSMRLTQFAPLAEVPGVVFVSLQKGGPAREAKTPPAGMRLLDWTDELEDFADTAALVEALDLVISVDTAVAHLAGALGKPVWVLNRFDACWRWLRDRCDSPWYPTMRLFRQSTAGDWDAVMQRVALDLGRLPTLLSE